MLIQLAALALAASGGQLSANFPNPPQRLAVHEMLVAQFVGSAMFLPVLFRGGWRGLAVMAAVALGMLLVAGRLAGTPTPRVLAAWGEVAGWIVMLSLWRAAVVTRSQREPPTPASRSAAETAGRRLGRGPAWTLSSAVLAAGAMLLSAGGLLFAYLQAEFQAGGELIALRLFPLTATLRHLDDPATKPSPLLSTVALSAAAVVILAAKAAGRAKSARSPAT